MLYWWAPACSSVSGRPGMGQGRQSTRAIGAGVAKGSGTGSSSGCCANGIAWGGSPGDSGASMGRTHELTRPRQAAKSLPAVKPSDHAEGRSSGGFGHEFHPQTDSPDRPLSVKLSAGQAQESKYLMRLLERVKIGRRCRPGALVSDYARRCASLAVRRQDSQGVKHRRALRRAAEGSPTQRHALREARAALP